MIGGYKQNALVPVRLQLEPPYRCWNLNTGPQEEQLLLLTAEPSLRELKTLLKENILLSIVNHSSVG